MAPQKGGARGQDLGERGTTILEFRGGPWGEPSSRLTLLAENLFFSNRNADPKFMQGGSGNLG